MLKMLFGLPNLLDEIFNYVEDLDGSEWICNITQTKHWRSIVDKLN